MVKHGFKVGDRVRLNGTRGFKSLEGKVLTIMGFDSRYILIDYKGMEKGFGFFPLYPSEIEFVIKVGEQLQFQFMSEAN